MRGSELIIDSERVAPAGRGGRVAGEDPDGVGSRRTGASDHSKSVRVDSRSSAAAWRSAWSAERVLPSQKPPDSTPPDDSPVEAASPAARIIAVRGSSQPRTGDQRTPAAYVGEAGGRVAGGRRPRPARAPAGRGWWR